MKKINKVILNNITNAALWFLALALVLELLLWLPWSEVLKWVIVMLPMFVFSVLIVSAIDYYIKGGEVK